MACGRAAPSRLATTGSSSELSIASIPQPVSPFRTQCITLAVAEAPRTQLYHLYTEKHMLRDYSTRMSHRVVARMVWSLARVPVPVLDRMFVRSELGDSDTA